MSEYLNVDAIEQKFDLRLPARFRSFLASNPEELSGKKCSLPHYQNPMAVYFDGTELESFINDDWPDFDEESGMPYGHTSATEIDFENDLQGWIPLATIGEEESQVLLCRVDDPVCPVGMWEHETNSVVAVADSLDDFLASLVDADD